MHASRTALRLVRSLVFAGACLACSREQPRDEPGPTPIEEKRGDAASEAPEGPGTTAESPRLLLEDANVCEIHHRGLVLDFADPSLRAQESFRLSGFEQPVFTERGGVRLRRLDRADTVLDFFWSEATTSLELTALVHGLDADRISFSIDGRPFDTAKPKAGAVTQISLSARDFPLSAGRHRLGVHQKKKNRRGGSTEIAWLRLGKEEREGSTDHPPARSSVLGEVTIGSERKRSVVLREGGSLECPLWIAARGARFTGHVGLWGTGKGIAELVARTPDGKRRVLATQELGGDAAASWLPLAADLGDLEGFVRLELHAPRLSRGARLAFGEPALRDPETTAPVPAPRAKRVLVVVLAGLDRQYSPPRAAELGLPLLHQFEKEAARFPGYRTTTTSSQGVVTSMLTGAHPTKHRVVELDTRLRQGIPLLAETVHTLGAEAGMFTGVPTTFGAFGFDRGFEVFEAVSPVLDRPAIEPLQRARSFVEKRLTSTRPLLAVVHLRGAHPPFDVTREAARELAPPEYGGDLDPRRAALQLAAVRNRPRAANRRLPDEDWVRLAALEKRALLDQDAALGSFFRFLKDRNAWNDTLVVIVGDVSAGSQPLIPFDERAELTEDQLHVPLFVKFPGQALAGRSISGLYGPEDLFATLLDALGQEIPEGTVALGQSQAETEAKKRAHVAARQSAYATRRGPYLLRGVDGKVPTLCRVDLDPLCTLDRSEENPLAVQNLWFVTFSELASIGDATPKDETDRASLDDETRSALVVWGVDPG